MEEKKPCHHTQNYCIACTDCEYYGGTRDSCNFGKNKELK